MVVGDLTSVELNCNLKQDTSFIHSFLNIYTSDEFYSFSHEKFKKSSEFRSHAIPNLEMGSTLKCGNLC